MTFDPECGACGKDYDLQVFLHIPSSNDIVLCTSCAAHEMSRSGGSQYRYQGQYLAIIERVTNDYLNLHPNAMEAARSMQAPYDQMLEEYHAQTAQAEELHKRRVDWIDLERQYDMPSDAVLDEYIDANPDKFQYVAYADNTEDMQLAGYRQWYDLRQSAIGG